MSNKKSPYQLALDDLEFRRTRCLEELRKIEAAITGLKGAMEVSVHMTPGTTSLALHPEATPEEIQQEAGQRYANMSVRWAVLKLLSSDIFGLTSAEISDELLKGGNLTASKATVSAVISDMVNKRNEVVQSKQGTYSLTDNGQAAWKAIEHSSKYQNRASSANEQ